MGVLGIARSVCAFSAASGGSDKFLGAAKLQKALLEHGCTLLVPYGGAEVEMEEVEVSVLPWVDGVAAALKPASAGEATMATPPAEVRAAASASSSFVVSLLVAAVAVAACGAVLLSRRAGSSQKRSS